MLANSEDPDQTFVASVLGLHCLPMCQKGTPDLYELMSSFVHLFIITSTSFQYLILLY